MQTELFDITPPAKQYWPANQFKPLWIGERARTEDTTTPQASAAYWHRTVALHPFFDPDKEHLVALMLNTKMKCFAWNMISIGTLNESVAHPREIMRPAVAAAAYGFVLIHNHPSGDSSPSDADHRVTRKISEAADILQIKLVDHVIVRRQPSDRHFSFREAALL
jgi:DNA repair protein RadC